MSCKNICELLLESVVQSLWIIIFISNSLAETGLVLASKGLFLQKSENSLVNHGLPTVVHFYIDTGYAFKTSYDVNLKDEPLAQCLMSSKFYFDQQYLDAAEH